MKFSLRSEDADLKTAEVQKIKGQIKHNSVQVSWPFPFPERELVILSPT